MQQREWETSDNFTLEVAAVNRFCSVGLASARAFRIQFSRGKARFPAEKLRRPWQVVLLAWRGYSVIGDAHGEIGPTKPFRVAFVNKQTVRVRCRVLCVYVFLILCSGVGCGLILSRWTRLFDEMISVIWTVCVLC